MYALFFLVFIVIPGYNTHSTMVCDGLVYRGKYYDKHMLFETQRKPYNMFYDRFSGELIFSNTEIYGRKIDFRILTCHVKTRICRQVQGIPGGYAIAYDYGNDDIYLGGDQGLYKYNFETKHAAYFAERGKSIWGIFIRRHFFYIRHPEQQLYVNKRGKFIKVPETIGYEIDNFFVSKKFNVYFYNRTGLYTAKLNKKGKKPRQLTNKIEVRQIVEDYDGIVYICASDGIYIIDDTKINKVANIDQAYSITFINNFHLSTEKGRNQLIYSDKYAIYVLTRNNQSNLCAKAYELKHLNRPVKIVKVVL